MFFQFGVDFQFYCPVNVSKFLLWVVVAFRALLLEPCWNYVPSIWYQFSFLLPCCVLQRVQSSPQGCRGFSGPLFGAFLEHFSFNSVSGFSSIALLLSAPFQKRRFPQLRIESATEMAPGFGFFVSVSKRHDRRFPQLSIGIVTEGAPVFASSLAFLKDTIAVFLNFASVLSQKGLLRFASSFAFPKDPIAVSPTSHRDCYKRGSCVLLLR